MPPSPGEGWGIIAERPKSPQESPGQNWRVTYALICGASMIGFASHALAFAPTVILYARDLGATPLQIGMAVGISGLIGIVLRVPSGAVSTIIGRKTMMLVGAVAFVAGPLVLAEYRSLGGVFLAMSIYGIANLYMPSAVSFVNDVVPARERGTYIGFYTMWGGIGRVPAPFLAGYLIQTVGYTWVFYLCAILGAISVLLLVLLPLRRYGKGTEPLLRQVSRDLGRVMRQPRLVYAAAARGLQSVTMGTMHTFFPLYATGVAGLDALGVGILQTGQQVCGLLARPTTGWLSSRTGRVPFMFGGMLAASALLFTIPHLTAFVPLLLAVGGMGIAQGTCQISTIAYVSDHAGPRMFGAAVGVVGGFFDLGLVSGRFVPGLVLPAAPQAPHFVLAFAIVGAVVGFSGLLVPGLLRDRRDPNT